MGLFIVLIKFVRLSIIGSKEKLVERLLILEDFKLTEELE